jgi:LmbE family N-acetylglucosaminyl deacetylase
MADENRRVLALMPHPDDMEILCAGTLLRLHALGWEIHVATMTPGDKGSATLPTDEIAAIRREEARRGAAAIGAATYRCLEFADCEIVFDNDARRRVAGLLRAVDPILVFTTPPDDYMLDHEITSRLVRDACFNAPIRNYSAGGRRGRLRAFPTCTTRTPSRDTTSSASRPASRSSWTFPTR